MARTQLNERNLANHALTGASFRPEMNYFDETKNYSINNIVIWQGKFYKATSNITGLGEGNLSQAPNVSSSWSIDTSAPDMAKSIYDTNSNNIVDNSEKVNNLTVLTAVPSGAVFTDTVYDDSALDTRVTNNTNAISGKFDKTGGTISGNTTVNGKIVPKNVQFQSLYSIGTTSSFTINITNGQYQTVTLNGSGNLTITAPGGPCTFYLHVHQDGTGGRVLTLPSGKWVDGTIKHNTTTANAHDLLMIHYYGGSSYVFEYMLKLS